MTTPQDAPTDDSQTAADLIRDKVSRIYADEPNAGIEAAEAEQTTHRTPHQAFMHQLSTSGKDLATVQTEWHNYYQSLPADQKHQVWHEFYANQSSVTGVSQGQSQGQPAAAAVVSPHALAEHKQQTVSHSKRQKKAAADKAVDKPKKLRDIRSAAEVQAAIRDKVTAGGKLNAKHHLQSLLFGLGAGAIVLLIFLFGFFNEVVIAPFIQPARVEASTPLIVSDTTVPASTQPEVIIPKINVEIPVDYTQTTTDENQIENALENGVVHYPTTVKPGEVGNTAIFGHSSNNIFNKGKYKFAFVLLHTLVNGDTFYLTYNGKVYAYKVIDRKVVDPSEVSVLNAVAGQTSTATLITCDPPGTSLKRLVVIGQQISPDPAGNAAAATPAVSASNAAPLPGNGPTLWGRFIKSPLGKAVVVIVLLGAIATTIRTTTRRGRR